MTDTIAELERLLAEATRGLLNATPRGLELLLRCGAENQRPRADNWDRVDYAKDGEVITRALSALPDIIAAYRDMEKRNKALVRARSADIVEAAREVIAAKDAPRLTKDGPANTYRPNEIAAIKRLRAALTTQSGDDNA